MLELTGQQVKSSVSLHVALLQRMIIEDGEDRYKLAFEGDLKKSAAVMLRRKR